MKVRALAAAVVVFGLGLLVGRSTAPQRSGSGIQGTVILDSSLGASHYDRPQRGCQRVLESTNGIDTTGALVTRFCSGKNGRFQVRLAPGKYMIDVGGDRRVGDGVLKPVGPVEVRRDVFTSVNVVYHQGQ